jgi:drug/metabolite transporter (DMT)-like permease
MVATICELFFPISAVMFDYIFNGSRLSWVQWGSAAVMVFAIIQLNRDKARK